MTKNINSSLRKLLLLLLTLSILISSLTSCGSLFVESEDQIQSNINGAQENEEYSYVAEYLEEWELPNFNSIKFIFIEEIFIQLYNYGDGLPDTLTHAKLTAELFLEKYYGKIKLHKKTAVTDALLDCYVEVIGDPYSAYRPPVEAKEYLTDMTGKFGGIGVMVEYNDLDESIMINTVYPGSPAEKAGVMVGDFIHAVDGKTIEELGYDEAINYVRGKIGTKVTLTLLRDGEYVTVTAIRDEVEEINVVYYHIPEHNLGYVRIVSFKDNTFPQFKEAVDELQSLGVEGYVFDLRSNPGGKITSVCDVISYLVPDGTEIMSYRYKEQVKSVLLAEDEGEDHVLTDLPMVVLCNQYTASAGEIFTSAIRDYRNENMLDATIVGTTTYKKGIMQNSYYYPFDKSTVTLTVAYYDPPCGVNYHGIGITPDVYVENTKTEDLQYDAGIEELLKLINDN